MATPEARIEPGGPAILQPGHQRERDGDPERIQEARAQAAEVDAQSGHFDTPREPCQQRPKEGDREAAAHQPDGIASPDGVEAQTDPSRGHPCVEPGRHRVASPSEMPTCRSTSVLAQKTIANSTDTTSTTRHQASQ